MEDLYLIEVTVSHVVSKFSVLGINTVHFALRMENHEA